MTTRPVEKFILSFVSSALLLIAGFFLIVFYHGHTLTDWLGGTLMVTAMSAAALMDIRLRSPQVAKPHS